MSPRRLALAAALLAALAGPAAAEGPLPPGVTKLAIIPGWRDADGLHHAAIEIRLAPGWHTYWRAPGQIGIPPRFDWSGSANLAGVAYDWPRPEVIESYGSVSIGYHDALVLPVRLRPADPEAPIEARLALAFGVCDDICIPAEASLAARLEPGAAPAGRAAIERARADRPLAAAEAGVTAARCALADGAAGQVLTAEIDFAAPPRPGLVAVFEADARPDLWIGEAETATEGRRVTATAPFAALDAGPVAVERGALRLTLLDDARAIDIHGCAG
jgi:DsbC/DsbD-like thiol-disulfide interchange protein